MPAHAGMQPLRQSILDMEAIMSVADIYEKRATFSFEVFPPKTDVGMEKLCGKDGVLDKLYTLQPDYISCTYGAGGTNVGKNLEVLDKIQKDGKTIPVTHFTCIGNTKEDIKEKLQTYLDHGIDHMLALCHRACQVRPQGVRRQVHHCGRGLARRPHPVPQP